LAANRRLSTAYLLEEQCAQLHVFPCIRSHDVECSATVRDEILASWESRSFVARDDPNPGIDPLKRHAPDFYHGGGDFSPRVGDFTHRGDELHHSSVHLTARTGEKQFGRPQLRPHVGDFKRFVVDILPLIKRIPRLAPHMRRSAP
jgi:hypothetical protein